MFPQVPEAFATTYPDSYDPFYGIFTLLSRLFFVFILIDLAIAIYLFIDARNNRRNFILWPLATLFSAIIFGLGPFIVLFIYIATRGETDLEYEQGGENLGQGIKRAYFYIFSFIVLGILLFGIADLIRVILDFNWGGSQTDTFNRTISYTRDSFTKNVSFRLATIIVTLPIWFFHWYHVQSNLPKIDEPHDLKVTFRTHKSYLYLVSGITLAVVIIFGIWFVYQILNLLLGVSDIRLGSFAAPIGYTLTSVVAFVYHFSILRGRQFQEIEDKVSSLPTPHPPASAIPTESKAAAQKTTADKYCSKCGSKNTATNSYCVTCGNKLA